MIRAGRDSAARPLRARVGGRASSHISSIKQRILEKAAWKLGWTSTLAPSGRRRRSPCTGAAMSGPRPVASAVEKQMVFEVKEQM
jgi:hypothetical protein